MLPGGAFLRQPRHAARRLDSSSFFCDNGVGGMGRSSLRHRRTTPCGICESMLQSISRSTPSSHRSSRSGRIPRCGKVDHSAHDSSSRCTDSMHGTLTDGSRRLSGCSRHGAAKARSITTSIRAACICSHAQARSLRIESLHGRLQGVIGGAGSRVGAVGHSCEG